MREIKFRAWDGTKIIHADTTEGSGSSAEVFALDFFGRCSLVNVYGLSMKPLDIIPLTLMQYTGLKDKNGKEVYEGDVLQYKYYCANKRWWNRLEDIPKIEEEVKKQKEDISIRNSKIVFDNGSFRTESWLYLHDISAGEVHQSSRGRSCDTQEKWFDFEVIGNVYENPNLLT